jgi:hypothetical protein
MRVCLTLDSGISAKLEKRKFFSWVVGGGSLYANLKLLKFDIA